MDSNLLSLLKIPSVSEGIHYWIIRTNGGDYYEDFTLHEYISISWDYVSLSILYTKDDDEIKRLIEVYEKMSTTPEDSDDESDGTTKGKITAILNKINRFVFEIDKGDIILIPSKNSDRIAIAEVVGDVYETENYVESYLQANPTTEIIPCPYRKRRKIKILKTITKGQMDIYLARGFNSQHALSCMDEYAPYINRTIYGIYSRGDELHTTLHAGHPNGLTLKELVEFSTLLEKTASSIAQQCEIPFNPSQVEVKLNIHSPGLIELIGSLSGAGIVLSLLIFAVNNLINGGKLSISYKKDDQTGKTDFSVTSESPGISGNAQKNKRIELKEKEELLELVNKLDVKTPEVVAAILNGDKITPNMLVAPQPVEQLPESSTTKSEDNV
ncbi:hypothetical protein DXA65_14250 [Ruminococcus sp. OF03-6AA]|jgi:hypothetical protein|nr:hypothetical protein DXA65_14250 [Ruminococcus sp. OF03-6AA]